MNEEPRNDQLRLALAQANPVVGDVEGNAARALEARAHAARLDADALVLPELFISGYPPEDLILKPAFLQACQSKVEALAAVTKDGGPAIVIGTPWPAEGRAYNAVALLAEGRIAALRFKVDLPNYGVFDEKRVFTPGPMPGPVSFKGFRIGLPICEDIWGSEVVDCLAETGAELLLVINGSPYCRDKADLRVTHAVARVVESGLPLLYLNQLGGQDELVFDGASFGLNADRSLAFQMPAFEESLALITLSRNEEGKVQMRGGLRAYLPDEEEAIWRASVMGLADYVDKNRFPGVVLGLSGGIDSALVAVLATDALGKERVRAVMLPYRYTAAESLEDAGEIAHRLGIAYDIVPIAAPVEGFRAALAPLFAHLPEDVTEENLQSRVRGTLLMALSNKFGAMLLTTGNKSEVSVGYATLYGDMNGGFNPIKDLYKTDIYRLARWRNAHHHFSFKGPTGIVIPERVLLKAPTAELRPNQTDQDSLPPYEILDGILTLLVEKECSAAEAVAQGYAEQTVRRVEQLLYSAEYKRRQAAPGVKISARNFGRDRRYPITNRFRSALAPKE